MFSLWKQARHMYTDQQILALVERYMHGSDHPDQVGYREQTKGRDFANKTIFLDRLKSLARLGHFQNKRILDVGCGFGWHAFVIALMGNRVTGIDILPGMIEGMKDSIATMRREGISFDLSAVCGDICSTELQAGSFDAIYSNEAIEHVRDLSAMFARCRDLLKPGGSLFLINDANVLNRKTREEITEMWELREHSWDWVAQLKKWRPVEHAEAKPFAVMREEIVRLANPRLDPAAVKIIVTNTAGLIKPEIEQIAINYKPGFSFPEIGTYDRCRNPETGEYAERLLDPFALSKMLKKLGFRKTQVRHYFRRFPLNFTNGIQFRPINNLLFDLRGVFIVVGKV
ncbi:MAG TPA: methyltransferase domain-containing protein [Bryobacteraceae bacterium]|nr:methyltransferase domain-containing protein [Bryobacteraceae bacterium]